MERTLWANLILSDLNFIISKLKSKLAILEKEEKCDLKIQPL